MASASLGPSVRLIHADGPSLIKSNQKDVYYVGHMHEMISGIIKRIVCPKTWLSWHAELHLFAEILYFGLTTLSGRQTFGEEYSNILQVSPKGSLELDYKTPSWLRRVSFLMLQTLGPFIIRKWLTKLRSLLSRGAHNASDETKQKFCKILDGLQTAIRIASQFHLAFFYLTATHYHLAKRVASVKYMSLVEGTFDLKASNPYSPLGLLLLIQLGLELASLAQGYLDSMALGMRDAEVISVRSETENIGTIETAPKGSSQELSLRCSLCLGNVKAPAATQCGHVFCWHCIIPWCSREKACPICRTSSNPQQIVFLHHFSV